MNRLYLSVAVAGLASLAACSDSGSSAGSPPGMPPPTAGLFQQYQDSITDIVGPVTGVVSQSTLPTTGTVGYTGVMGLSAFQPELTFDLRGALDLEISFDGNTVTGEARDFVDVNDRPFTGTLDFANGVIDRAAAEPQLGGSPGMVVDFAGTLDSPDDGEIGFDSTFVGVFYNGATTFTGGGSN